MKSALILLLPLVAFAVAEFGEEPWVEEEELEEPYNEEDYRHDRKTRAALEDDEDVPDCHKRVRRAAAEPAAGRRPRRVHQYEVHEYHEEGEPHAAPYDEMLAASADHYHRVYAAPAAKAARQLKTDVSRTSDASGVHVPSHDPSQFASATAKLASFQQAPLNVANPVHLANYASESGPGPVAVSAASGLAPVAAAAGAPAARRLAEDQLGAAGAHRQQLRDDHWYAQGGGRGNKGHHYNEHAGKATKGFDSDHYVDKGSKGFKKDEKHRKQYEEAAGKKTKHRDSAAHQGDHEEEAYGHRGSNFAEKKGHKKGHKTKGFHNKYHKDEFKKEHKFYDDFHKSGEHHRYGKFNAKHASDEGGKKRAHHLNAGHDFLEHGNKGYSNKGHIDADHKGYNGKKGHEEHNENHSQYGKKGGRGAGASSRWEHGTKN